jgi:hypothetical protein
MTDEQEAVKRMVEAYGAAAGYPYVLPSAMLAALRALNRGPRTAVGALVDRSTAHYQAWLDTPREDEPVSLINRGPREKQEAMVPCQRTRRTLHKPLCNHEDCRAALSKETKT